MDDIEICIPPILNPTRNLLVLLSNISTEMPHSANMTKKVKIHIIGVRIMFSQNSVFNNFLRLMRNVLTQNFSSKMRLMIALMSCFIMYIVPMAIVDNIIRFSMNSESLI